MKTLNVREAVEVFHLLFLQYLGTKLDKKLYALKGGCNLRFFFQSIRYSEDIDFDLTTIALETLQKKVNGILTAQSFRQVLQARGLKIIHSQEAKQTQTTQRWKLQLQITNLELPIPTKIEFSRRNFDPELGVESIAPPLLHEYRLPPILATHYLAQAAVRQKVAALIGRTETQARDIFDLYWLFSSHDQSQLPSPSEPEHLQQAIQRAQSLSFDEFRGQVVSYLKDDHLMQYDSLEAWEFIVNQVVKMFKAWL